MELKDFLNKLNIELELIDFTETISVIDLNYDYTPSAFANGNVINKTGQNEGSCKILAFAILNKLSKEQTLHCFGKYYREEVLNDPEGESHQNIRQFIKHSFDGIKFERAVLQNKARK
jgi:type III HopJ-like effector protein